MSIPINNAQFDQYNTAQLNQFFKAGTIADIMTNMVS